MSEEARVISLSVGTLLIAGAFGIALNSIGRDIDRLADAAEAQLCIQAVQAGAGTSHPFCEDVIGEKEASDGDEVSSIA